MLRKSCSLLNSSKQSATSKPFDAVIVGAGLSGLRAATTLRSAGVSNFCVLEASNRIGGRILTDPEDSSIELGAAFFGPGQHRMLSLVDKFGLKLVDAVPSSKTNNKPTYNLLVSADRGQLNAFRWTSTSVLPDCSFAIRCDINNAVRKISKLCETVDVENPDKTPNAQQLDSVRIPQFLRAICWTSCALSFLLANFRALLTTEPENVSVLALLWFLRCAGGFNALLHGELWKMDYSSSSSGTGGNTQIVDRLFTELGGEATIKLQCPVRSVEFDEATSLVSVAGDSFSLTARNVIFAVPPPQLSRMMFQPQLSVARRTQLESFQMGNVIKTFTFFSQPFWKNNNNNASNSLSGRVLCNNINGGSLASASSKEHGMVACDVYDISTTHKSKEPSTDNHCLLGFIDATDADIWGTGGKTSEHRRDALLKQFSSLFADGKSLSDDATGASLFRRYRDKNWAEEPWIGGAFFALGRAGTLSSFGREWCQPLSMSNDAASSSAESKPVLFFAGTEAATCWSGYMEGAVAAADRAAEGVLKNLGVVHEIPESTSHAAAAVTDSELINPRLPNPDTVVAFVTTMCFTVAVLWFVL